METKNKMQMEHFFAPNSGEDQKKRKKVFSENRSLIFFPTFTLRCTPIQIIGGDADVDHSQTIGGDTAKLLGDIFPLVSAPLSHRNIFCAHW